MILPHPRRACAALFLLLVALPSPAQTLARPGWAGSGLTVSQWWRNSVIVEVPARQPGSTTVLQHTLAQLADLQTLGADAILLRGLESDTPRSGGTLEAPLSASYGTLDDFDQLMREASGRRIRLLVELPSSGTSEALVADARFWLSRGVSGVYLAGAPGVETQAKRHALRAALHGYIGDRILLGDRAAADPNQNPPEPPPDRPAPTPKDTSRDVLKDARGDTPTDSPDILFSTLRGFGAGAQPTDVAAVRASLEAARRSTRGVTAIAVDPSAPPVTGEEAKARAATLLLARGSIALRAEDIGIGPEEQAKLQETQWKSEEQHAIDTATSPAAASNARRAAERRRAAAATAIELPGDATFVWYQRVIGLHRGNATMLGGEQTILNHDDAGALVAVWKGRAGQPLVAVVNLRGTPAKFQLAEDLAKLQTRGHFLRTVVRSDAGLGAMSLTGMMLSAYGVYLGQIGR